MERGELIVRLLGLTVIVALCSACPRGRPQGVDASPKPISVPESEAVRGVEPRHGPEPRASSFERIDDRAPFLPAARFSEAPLRPGAPTGTLYVRSESEGEQIDSVTTNVGTLQEILRANREAWLRVVLYHIHPAASHPLDPMCPPNGVDIYAEANLKRAMQDDYRLLLEARVIDGSGCWRYDVSSELEDFLRLPRYSGSTVRWIDYPEVRPYLSGRQLMRERQDEFLFDFERETAPLSKRRERLSAERVDDFIRISRSNGVLVGYTRMEPLSPRPR